MWSASVCPLLLSDNKPFLWPGHMINQTQLPAVTLYISIAAAASQVSQGPVVWLLCYQFNCTHVWCQFRHLAGQTDLVQFLQSFFPPPFNVQTLRGNSKHQTIMMLLLNSFNERLPAKTKLGRLQCAEIILLWWQAQDWDFDPCGPVQAWREFSLPLISSSLSRIVSCLAMM